jgi:uncharacterized cofD-like protein
VLAYLSPVAKIKRIVVIGGGTGTYTVLKGLKKYPIHLSAIVSMTDSGGSNRVLRDEFGILPTSDIRQCIVALATGKSNGLIRELFTYRYNQGTGISGMTFGNLFMAAVTDIYGSQQAAIQKTCRLLGVKGDILPVTYDKCHLVAGYENGKEVLGEHDIDEPSKVQGKFRITNLKVIPNAAANHKALRAIAAADLIVLGPGDLFTSIICNLVVGGIPKAIIKSRARKIFVINLMNKFGQTNAFRSSDYLSELEKYLKPGIIDVCLINNKTNYSKAMLKKYRQENADPVVDNFGNLKHPKIIHADFVSSYLSQIPKGDSLKRSLIRHDSDKLAKAIIALL